MPIKRVQFPDGSIKRVEVPEGATNEQVLAFVQSQYQPPKQEWKPRKRSVEELREGKGFDPTEGMSGLELNLAGIGESIDTTVRGLRDLGTDAARYFAEQNPILVGDAPLSVENILHPKPQRSLSGLISGKDDTVAGRLRAKRAEQMAEEARIRQLNAPLNATAAGMTGNITGTVGQIVGPGGLLKLGAQTPLLASRAPMLNTSARAFLPETVRGAAAQGAVIGATQPLTEGESRLGNLGFGTLAAGGGAAIPRVVGAVASKAASLLPKVTQRSQERAAADVIRNFASDPQAALAAAQAPEMIVPGSIPTLAEASGDVGLIGLQRTLANTPEFGNRLAELRRTSNAARVAAIEQGFGGADDAAVDAIKAARDAAARQTLKPIERIPLSGLSKVVAGVKRLSEKHPASRAVQTAMEAVKERLPLIRTVGDAHDVRQEIGELMAGRVEGKAGAKLAKRQLMVVRDLLDREMRAAYPQWGAFLREYRAASREAGQVATGAELLGTGRAVRTATNQPELTPAAFSRAAENLDRTVARATSFPRATAAKTLTPEQLRTVDAVRRDLERYSRGMTEGKAVGSNTMQNIVGGNRLQDAVGPVGAAAVEPISGIALLGLNQMRKAYGQKVAAIVEEAMLDPARAAEILSTLPPSQRAQIVRQVAGLIPRAGGLAGAVAPAVEQ